MPAGKYNLKIEQGAKYGVRFTYTDNEDVPVDLTDYTAKLQFRETKDSVDTLYDSTTNNDIVLGGVAGTVDLNIDTVTTTAFDFDSCLYDLELVDSVSEVTRLIEGRVYLSKEVTRQ